MVTASLNGVSVENNAGSTLTRARTINLLYLLF